MPDIVILALTADQYRTAADGADAQVGVTFGKDVERLVSIKAIRSKGQVQADIFETDWGGAPRIISVKFKNDLWGGSATQDRNAFVYGATVDGTLWPVDGSVSLMSTGSIATMTDPALKVAAAPVVPAPAPVVPAPAPVVPAPAPVVPAPAPVPTPGSSQCLIGVNLSGGEFNGGKAGAKLWTDYAFPSTMNIDYHLGKGFKVIRLPFCGERACVDASGTIDPTSDTVKQLQSLAAYVGSKGAKLLLDPHGFGYFFGVQIGTTPAVTAAFAQCWGGLAAMFALNPNVIFGLINEPHDFAASALGVAFQACITAIRGAGAVTQYIHIAPQGWGGFRGFVGSDSQRMFEGLTDPAGKLVLEGHVYPDSDGSGTHNNDVSGAAGALQALKDATTWATTGGHLLFLGETGVSPDTASLAVLKQIVAVVKGSPCWTGMAYWCGGPWMGTYPFTVEPANGVDQPQIAVLLA